MTGEAGWSLLLGGSLGLGLWLLVSLLPILRRVAEERAELQVSGKAPEELSLMVGRLEAQMKEAARNLEFERAAALRDEILQLRRLREELAAAPGSIPAEVYAAAAEAGDNGTRRDRTG